MKKIKTIIVAFLLLSFSVSTVWAAVLIKDSFVNLGKHDMTIAQALREIERQTGCIFAVNNSTLDTSAKARIAGKPVSLDNALYTLLDGTGHTYRIVDKHILIVPGSLPQQAVETQPSQTNVVVADWWSGDERSNLRQMPAKPSARKINESFESTPEAAVAVPVQKTTHLESDEVILGTPGRLVGKDGIPPQLMSPAGGERPRIALKTNAVYWATLTPNLGVEIGLGKRTTANIFAAYNPWNLNGSVDNNRKLVHFVIQPEFRYWFCERFNGHSIGLNMIYSRYNIGGYDVPFLFEKQYRYEGSAIGGGISWGYHLMLGQRWGVEFSAGVGVLNLNYNFYDCGLCGDLVQSGTKLYFGPTKAGVTLVFLIK